MPAPRPDLIIVGGGLAGGLAALALRQKKPELSISLVEPGSIGGNHLWSFFASDIAQSHRSLVDALASRRWPGYEVLFPSHRRRVAQPYSSIESEALDRAVRSSGTDIVAAAAIKLTPTSVHLSDGGTIHGTAVIDARGLTGPVPALSCGWQKFVGRMLTVVGGHGIAEPVVMDATVDQQDGYRFVYLLPFSATEIFVEDTYYSQSPGLDQDALDRRIEEYADARGWRVGDRSRHESGVLPVVTGGSFDEFWPESDTVSRAGVRAGLFHPLTSYSLPDAVRFAHWLAAEAPLDERLGEAARAYAKAHWRRGRFDRMLARMLMTAAEPQERYRVLERFYRLPAPLIERFYAGRSSLSDRIRIRAGRPPVPIAKALRAIMERA
jgi:lycopene beta-cyclase